MSPAPAGSVRLRRAARAAPATRRGCSARQQERDAEHGLSALAVRGHGAVADPRPSSTRATSRTRTGTPSRSAIVMSPMSSGRVDRAEPLYEARFACGVERAAAGVVRVLLDRSDEVREREPARGERAGPPRPAPGARRRPTSSPWRRRHGSQPAARSSPDGAQLGERAVRTGHDVAGRSRPCPSRWGSSIAGAPCRRAARPSAGARLHVFGARAYLGVSRKTTVTCDSLNATSSAPRRGPAGRSAPADRERDLPLGLERRARARRCSPAPARTSCRGTRRTSRRENASAPARASATDAAMTEPPVADGEAEELFEHGCSAPLRASTSQQPAPMLSRGSSLEQEAARGHATCLPPTSLRGCTATSPSSDGPVSTRRT